MRAILTSAQTAVNGQQGGDSGEAARENAAARHVDTRTLLPAVTPLHTLIPLVRLAPFAALVVVLASGCGGVAATSGASAGEDAARPTPPPRPPSVVRPFAARGVWNRPLPSGARVSRTSRAIVAALAREAAAERTRGSDPWINDTTPLAIVPAEQSTIPVTLVDHRPDAALERAWRAVPLPASATPSTGSDHELIVWQPARDRLWEFWHLRRTPAGWAAQWGGAMGRVHTNAGWYSRRAWPGAERWWGASATSLPLLGGLIRTAELDRGTIEHALALAVPATAAGVFRAPAQRTDGVSTAPSSVPEGTRLRLDPSLRLARLHLSPPARAIARALQRYGAIVRDTSPNIAFYAEAKPTGADPLAAYPLRGAGAALAGFPWRRLQVLAGPLHGRR
jgi:hypothetical protein